MKKIIFILFLLVIPLCSCFSVQAYDVPAYEGYVNDFAGVLSEDFEAQLEEKLQAVSTGESGSELAVVTITSLSGEPVEYVAQDFFDEWGIGKKGIDNGVLLLIAVDDRELRIATGYGAEAVIPDSVAGRIIRNDITPHFKEADYETGVIAGVDKILSYLDNPEEFAAVSTETTSSGETFTSAVSIMFLFGLVVVGFSYLASFLGRSKSWWLGGVIGFIGGLMMGGLIVAIVLAIIGLIFDYILSQNYKSLKKAGKSTGWKSSWGGFSSGGGWSSGSSGGSFGGGSSGGGGASGKW